MTALKADSLFDCYSAPSPLGLPCSFPSNAMESKLMDKTYAKLQNLLPARSAQVVPQADALSGDIFSGLTQPMFEEFTINTPDVKFLDNPPAFLPAAAEEQQQQLLLTEPEDQQLLPSEQETSYFSVPIVSEQAPMPAASTASYSIGNTHQSVLTVDGTQLLQLLQESQTQQFPVSHSAQLPVPVNSIEGAHLKLEPPSPASSDYSEIQQAGSPSGNWGTGEISQPKGKGGKRKQLNKTSDEYRLRRERNNVAVRKSRTKAKYRQETIEGRNKYLESQNKDLGRKVETMQRELDLLKQLFTNAGLKVPSKFSSIVSV